MQESEKGKWRRSVVSHSLWPHGLQPPRLLRPWDFPGKSTRVGCYCLLRHPRQEQEKLLESRFPTGYHPESAKPFLLSSGAAEDTQCPQPRAVCWGLETSVALIIMGQTVRHNSRLRYPLLQESGSITPSGGTFLQPARNSASQMVGPPCSPRDSQESSPTPQFKSANSLALSFLYGPTLTSIHDLLEKPQLWLDRHLLAK